MVCSVESRKYFLYFRKRKNAYSYLFNLFHLIGIFNCFTTRRSVRNKIVQYISFVIVTVFFVTISLLELKSCFFYMLASNVKSGVIYALTCVIYMLFRISLHKSFLALKKIVTMVLHISSKIKNKFNLSLWIYTWIIVVLISRIYTAIQLTSDISNYNYILNYISFGYSSKSVYFKLSLSVAYSLCYVIFLCMPLSVFDFYYVIICTDISSLFISFVDY